MTEQKRITFAYAIHDAHDTKAHPWVYATDASTGGGHTLLVAHCAADCEEPTSCACEEQTELAQPVLSELFIQAVAAGVLSSRDIEQWNADDANLILQIALYGEIIFG